MRSWDESGCPYSAHPHRHRPEQIARATLAQLTAQRSVLTARLIDTQEAERRELARDLHDEMGQGLAALQAASGGIRMSAQAQEPARAEDTDTIDETITQLHAGLRALLGRLRPPLLESQGWSLRCASSSAAGMRASAPPRGKASRCWPSCTRRRLGLHHCPKR